MDIGAIAIAFVASRAADLQVQVAARLLRMNAQSAEAVAKLVQAAQANTKQFADVAAGIGGNIDITA